MVLQVFDKEISVYSAGTLPAEKVHPKADATGSEEEIFAEFRRTRDLILRDFFKFYNKNIRK